jgi:hypothetical protein
VIGNFSMLVTVAEAILSFLPAVGPATARRSRTILHRTSRVRAALIGRIKDSRPTRRATRLCIDAEANTATVKETLSP